MFKEESGKVWLDDCWIGIYFGAEIKLYKTGLNFYKQMKFPLTFKNIN